MTPESINIAIAEELEYRYEQGEEPEHSWAYQPAGWWYPNGGGFHRGLPNFYSDLNACAEMEASLGTLGAEEYGRQLQEVTGWHCVGIVPDYRRDLVHLSRVARATAPQRCEAFLKVKSKWIEEKGKQV